MRAEADLCDSDFIHVGERGQGFACASLQDQQPLDSNHASLRIRSTAERIFCLPLTRFNNTTPYVYKIPNIEQPFGDGREGVETMKKPDQEKPPGRSKREESSRGVEEMNLFTKRILREQP